MVELHKQFIFYLQSVYDKDFLFQQSYRPFGTVSKLKAYFSGKPDLYGYKPEISVVYFDLAIGHSRVHSEAKADIKTVRTNKNWHDAQLQEFDEKISVPNIGEVGNVSQLRQYWVR